MDKLRVDILHNEWQGHKAPGVIGYLFIALFAGTGVFILYKTYRDNGERINYLTASCPLLLALFIYLQLTGKASYKKYFQVDIEKLQYCSIPFSTTVIYWTQVNSIECEHSKIRLF